MSEYLAANVSSQPSRQVSLRIVKVVKEDNVMDQSGEATAPISKPVMVIEEDNMTDQSEEAPALISRPLMVIEEDSMTDQSEEATALISRTVMVIEEDNMTDQSEEATALISRPVMVIEEDNMTNQSEEATALISREVTNMKQLECVPVELDSVQSNGGAIPKLTNKAIAWSDDSSECRSRLASRGSAGAVPKARRKRRRVANKHTERIRFRQEVMTKEELMKAWPLPISWYEALRGAANEDTQNVTCNDELTAGERLLKALCVPIQCDEAIGRAANENTQSVSFREELTTTEQFVKYLSEPVQSEEALGSAASEDIGSVVIYDEATRIKQLKKDLSVPIECDEAIRMMRGMGWSGGALGARGNGITEPLKPNLNFVGKAKPGLGYSKDTQPETTTGKQNNTWVSENEIVLMEPPQSNCNDELPEPEKQYDYVVVLEDFSRIEFLRNVCAFLDVSAPYKTLKYLKKLRKNSKKFVTNALSVINKGIVNYGLFQKEEFNLYTQILVKNQNMRRTSIEAIFLDVYKIIELKKVSTDPETPTDQMPTEQIPTEQTPMLTEPRIIELQRVTIDPETPTERTPMPTAETIKSYILSTNTECSSQKAFSILKFKVLFLMNILNFVKSLNEESEVTFSKILTPKEKRYIQDVIDELNMRINFGSSAAEKKLCVDVKKFLGAMFNHHYTVVTLTKYFRFKRLNRPDDAVKRKYQTTFSLDIYKSETVSENKMKISELTESENDNNGSENNYVVENELTTDNRERTGLKHQPIKRLFDWLTRCFRGEEKRS